MKILIDECVPHVVKKGLPHRSIMTVQQMNWAGIKNGELLKLVRAEFDIFMTSDKNLRYQQNLNDSELAIIILPSNQVPVLKEMLDQIDDVLDRIRLGEIVEM